MSTASGDSVVATFVAFPPSLLPCHREPSNCSHPALQYCLRQTQGPLFLRGQEDWLLKKEVMKAIDAQPSNRQVELTTSDGNKYDFCISLCQIHLRFHPNTFRFCKPTYLDRMSSERAFVYQLIEGHAIQDDVGFKATGSVTLIRDGPLRILVDCGDPWNGGELINKLMQRETTCSEVTHVVVTHGHVDHCGNLSLFKNAQVFMSYDFVGPDGIYGSIDKEKGYAISENVRVEVMKGHTAVDLIVRVKNTVHGTVIVAGDLFEREHDGSSWEQLSEYPEEQKQSRQRILDEADVIVPGHGPLFHVEK